MKSGYKDLNLVSDFGTHFSQALLHHEELHGQLNLPEWDFKGLDPVADSANVGPETWCKLVFLIVQNAEQYDGFLILHGTDTMAYTAAALSYFFHDTSLIIMLTGSMRPLLNKDSDAPGNLLSAFQGFNSSLENGVYIVFAGQYFSGVRTVKYKTHSDVAYSEPKQKLSVSFHNTPPSRAVADVEAVLAQWRPARIAILYVVPGFQLAFFKAILEEKPQALIFVLYGTGTAPTSDRGFLNLLREAHKNGIVMVGITQCYAGYIQLETYQAGALLHDEGVLSGKDMTLEAAYAKLQYLIGQGLEISEVKKHFSYNICGEISF